VGVEVGNPSRRFSSAPLWEMAAKKRIIRFTSLRRCFNVE
jgi:hypothetical protein